MTNSDTYKTINSVSEGLYKEKGSRFVSAAYPVSDEAEIKRIIEKVRKEHHEAKHNCYAYIIGNEGIKWRANDDGEPSGTAGRPILGQIRSFGLTNVLIIVSRYFGGTLLGVSGLVNAYKAAAESALRNSEITDHVVYDYYEISFPFASINDVMKIIKEENIIQEGHSLDLVCVIKILIRSTKKESVMARFIRIDGMNFRFLETK
jgi:uncharacterized YigZ family protein